MKQAFINISTAAMESYIHMVTQTCGLGSSLTDVTCALLLAVMCVNVGFSHN